MRFLLELFFIVMVAIAMTFSNAHANQFTQFKCTWWLDGKEGKSSSSREFLNEVVSSISQDRNHKLEYFCGPVSAASPTEPPRQLPFQERKSSQ